MMVSWQTKPHACLEHLPKLNIKGVLQGDLLFTDDKKVVSRGGAKHWCFTPNTLTYTVGCDTDLGRQIAKASVGIVFHTSYYGPTFAAMHSKFGVDTSELVDCDDVFAHHAYHDDPFNLCYLSDTDLQKFDRLVSMAQVRVTGASKLSMRLLLTSTRCMTSANRSSMHTFVAMRNCLSAPVLFMN